MKHAFRNVMQADMIQSVSQYAAKFYKAFIYSYFLFSNFISRSFFTSTNRIGYTKISSSDLNGERCTVLKSLGDIDYPEGFMVFLSHSMQMSCWRYRLCLNTFSAHIAFIRSVT
jgi:hypothetical protein